MSIFFRSFCYLLVALGAFQHISAQENNYNPIFVDTFLIQNSQEASIQAIAKKNEAANISSKPIWDIQKLKERNHVASMVVIIPIILLLLIILKFIFANFFKSSMLGLFNRKVFEFQYSNKKFSEILPLILIFLIRNATFVLILQFILSLILKRTQLLNLQTFLFLLVITNIFFTIKVIAEFIIQNILGSGSYFRMYFTQHYLLTLWLSLPILALILIMYLNSIELTMSWILAILLIPISVIALFSTIRSLMLWNGAWKHYLIYFFIYLCTFKIIPYLIIVKFASIFWL